MAERIAVLDFWGQNGQQVARRIREAGVYSELLPCDASIESIKKGGLDGIVLTGGAASVNAEGAYGCSDEVFSLGVPVLGICYGMHYIIKKFGGKVTPCETESGSVQTEFKEHPLFENVPAGAVWINHSEEVSVLPSGFIGIAGTQKCKVAAFADDGKKLYGVQFNTEDSHTQSGSGILGNFLKNICGLKCDRSMSDVRDQLIAEVRGQVGGGTVIAGLSGGVDSSVASVLVHQAIGDRLTCIFVDHGLLRLHEAEEVIEFFRGKLGLKVIAVDASERFLSKLSGVVDPEKKRKIIGEEFIRVFEEQAKLIGGADYLLQGTIYPDIIESGIGGAAVIKSHHNVGGLPKDIGFKGLVEPLKMLFKDEVRAIGEALEIPKEQVWRQPFPGPGLAVRVLGDITKFKLDILRHSDYILREEIKNAGLDREVWQYFTVFTGLKSVGIKNDKRTYDYAIGVRAVTSTDAMSVEWARLPHELLGRISSRIIAEVEHVNRVVYDITSKPPGTIEWE